MNRHQILKVTTNGETMYGVCIDPDKEMILLETGYVVDTKSNIYSGAFNSYESLRDFVLNPTGSKTNYINTAHTRNVPLDIRETLETASEAYHRSQKTILTLSNTIDHLIEDIATLSGITGAAQDALDNEPILQWEFADVFKRNLTGDMKAKIEEYAKTPVGYANKPCPFQTDMAWEKNVLCLYRHVPIEKDFMSRSFIQQMKTGTIVVKTSAGQNPEYKQLMREYSSVLPVTRYMNIEHIDVTTRYGYLYYQILYRIKLTRPLTRSYAKELAHAFSENILLDEQM